MRGRLLARLESLKKELETGQAELQKVEMQRTYLHETVLRISGAVQVLEELLKDGPHVKAGEAGRSDEDQIAPLKSRHSLLD